MRRRSTATTTTTTRMMTTKSFILTCANRLRLPCSTTVIMLPSSRLQHMRPRYPKNKIEERLGKCPTCRSCTPPHGRLAGIFCRDFHTAYKFFQELEELARDRWWPTWNDHNACWVGRPVPLVELKVLGALLYFALANGATQFMVSRQTNLGEEIHGNLF